MLFLFINSTRVENRIKLLREYKDKNVSTCYCNMKINSIFKVKLRIQKNFLLNSIFYFHRESLCALTHIIHISMVKF